MLISCSHTTFLLLFRICTRRVIEKGFTKFKETLNASYRTLSKGNIMVVWAKRILHIVYYNKKQNMFKLVFS